MKKIRIMIYNTAYFTGVTGTISEYINIKRSIFPDKSFKESLSKKIARVIELQKPDILFMAETREEDFMLPVKKLFSESHIDIKYKPGSVFNSFPFFKGNCNGVFMNESFKISKHYLQNGSKKLVYQVDINEDFSLFLAHFALGAKTRKMQFEEILQLTLQMKQSIVGGDFNIFDGIKEVKDLTEKGNLRVTNNIEEKTFPSYNPTHTIDLFLASKSINILDIQVLKDVQLSDHLPVILDIEIGS